MTILFISHLPITPHKGGIERVSYVLAKEFEIVGNNVVFISTTRPANDDSFDSRFLQIYINPFLKEDVNTFLNIIKIKRVDIVINQFLDYRSQILLETLYSEISDDLRPKIYSVLHNRPFSISGMGRIFKKLSYPENFKSLMMKLIGLCLPSFYEKQRILASRKLFASFLSLSDRFVLLSENYIPRLLDFMPKTDPKKLLAINNPNAFGENDYVQEEKENLIIFVGRLEDPQKNVKGFIDVWNYFYQSNPDWHCLIIGEGPHRKIFEDYSVKKRTRNLKFLGNRKDVTQFYSRARFLCMTSLYEGWPMVLMESMSRGCIPFVYNTFEALQDIIKDGVTGFIIPPYNAREMASKMANMAANKEACQKIITEEKRFVSLFSPEKIACQWLKNFNELK